MRKPSFWFGSVATIVVALTFAHPALADTASTSLGALEWMMSLFAALAMSIAEFLGKLVILVLDLCIPIMQYQGFTTAPVVVAGWAIVRDVVNMFFVVILIVIAMGTIFGHKTFQWKQQVPKLLIFAIVINFSKTLCGLMIDFAQVIMLTFANALKDIAGGNFIQLLGLGDVFSLSTTQATEAIKSTGTDSFDYFAAGLAAVLMMVWVLAVVVMLLFILVYRVVMLWILIVISPLAWFSSTIPFKTAGGSYAEWWKNFVCYTAIGPVIVFFLWLTLAVAGSGFIASQDAGFSSVATNLDGNTAGFINKIFEFQRLTSFVVGMAMLMAGFDAAAKICSTAKGPGFQAMLNAGKGVPGRIGSYVGGQATKLGNRGLSAVGSGAGSLVTGTGAAGVALATAGVAGLAGGGFAALKPTKEGEAARAKGLRDLSQKNWVPSSISTKLSKSADARQTALAEKLKKGSGEEFKGASDQTKLDRLKRVADKGLSMTPGAETAELGLLAEAIQDPKMRAKLEASGVLGKLYKTHNKKLKSFLQNTPGAKALDEFESGRPDLMGQDKIDNIDSTNVEKLDAGAYTDPRVQARLAKVESNVFDKKLNRNLTVAEAARRGKLGKQKQEAMRGKVGLYESMSPKDLASVPVEDLALNASEKLVGARSDLAAKMLASKDPAVRARLQGDRGMYASVLKSQLGIDIDRTTGAVTGADSAKLRAALKSQPGLMRNLDSSTVKDPAVLRDLVSTLDSSTLAKIAASVKASPGDEGAQALAARAQDVLNEAEATLTMSDPAGFRTRKASFDTQMYATESRLGASDAQSVSSQSASLADVQAKLANAQATLRSLETERTNTEIDYAAETNFTAKAKLGEKAAALRAQEAELEEWAEARAAEEKGLTDSIAQLNGRIARIRTQMTSRGQTPKF